VQCPARETETLHACVIKILKCKKTGWWDILDIEKVVCNAGFMICGR